MRLILGIASVLIFGGAVARAETIVLKNGSSVQGGLVSMTEAEVTLDTADMGRITIKRRAIRAILDTPSPTTPNREIVSPAPQSPTKSMSDVNVTVTNNNSDHVENKNNVEFVDPDPKISAVAAVDEEENIIYGGLSLGVGELKTNYGSDAISYQETYVVQWNVIGFKHRSGFGGSLLGMGAVMDEDDSGAGPNWAFIGGQLDYSFFEESNSDGSYTRFFAGALAGKFTLKNRLFAEDEVQTVEAVDEGEEAVHRDDGRALTNSIRNIFGGEVYGLTLGYEYLPAAGVGLRIATTGIRGHLHRTNSETSDIDDISGFPRGPDPDPTIEVYQITAGVTYVL